MRLIRRRRVRLHQNDPGPSIEGLLIGKPWRNAGHYVVKQPAILESTERTHQLEAREAWVPRERVLFVEVIA